jgi:hypothetical protein
MPYLDCPQCHASFHAGIIYAEPESCPRCGSPLYAPRRNFREQIRSLVFGDSPAVNEPPDWKVITGSQYAGRQYVSRPERSAGHDSGRPAHEAGAFVAPAGLPQRPDQPKGP